MSSLRSVTARLLEETIGEERKARWHLGTKDIIDGVGYRMWEPGRASIGRLMSLRNRYRGERCFIIGNGPSLGRMDLSPLRSEKTFGANRIYLMFEKLGFTTSFLVAVN